MNKEKTKERKINQKSHIAHRTSHNSGITLVALIITIVVLLILAVVAIGAVKESGIIGHAQGSTSQYKIAQEKEEINLGLNEWQIQKKIPGNTETFKSTMEKALEGKAEIVGDEKGPLTITMDETGNQYKVTNDGRIEENIPGGNGGETPEEIALKKYLFGENLEGRTPEEIFGDDGFIDDPTTDYDESTIQILSAASMYEIFYEYINYNNNVYKFRLTGEKLDGTYGLKKVEKIDTSTRVGKTVSYDNKLWTIIYDDSTNGLQMISNTVSENEFELGHNDSSITDWTKLDTSTEELKKAFEKADVNGNKSLDNDVEKAIYSYNNAIKTLNVACENLITQSEKSKIKDVRCVGSNPQNKNAEGEDYTPSIVEKWDADYDYKPEIFNKLLKGEDSNWISDYDRMVSLNIVSDVNDTYYWFASRIIGKRENCESFFLSRVGYILNDDGADNLLNIHDRGSDGEGPVRGWSYSNALRPVVVLEPDTQFTGEGTVGSPYRF